MPKQKIKLNKLDKESRDFLLTVMRKTQTMEDIVKERLDRQDKILKEVYKLLKDKQLV